MATAAPAKKEDGKGTEATGPLAKFHKMWENLGKSQKAAPVKVELPADKLAEIAKQLKFAPNLTEEQLAKVAAGGEEAVAILMQSIDAAGQQGFQRSLLASGKLLEEKLAEQQRTFSEMIPNLVKEAQLGASINKKLPGLDDPAVAPLVDVVRQGILADNPSASAEELEAATLQYFQNLGEVVNPQKVEPASQEQKTTDWNEYLGLPAQSAAKA